MNNSNEKVIFDFSTTDDRTLWESIDDRIMGGCSQSRSQISATGSLLFGGCVSLENRGGFASIRSPADRYDLSDYQGILLRVRGDGKRYKLGLRIDLFYDGVSYLAGFEAPQETWMEVFLPFDAFIPTHHGQRLKNTAPLDPHHIRSFVLLISEQQTGPFAMELNWVKAI